MKKNRNIKRIITLMESINPDFKRRFNPDVEADFEIESKTGDIISFTIEGESEYGDSGIGSYEFWGERGFDTNKGYVVNDYRLKEDSYDPEYKEEINDWIKHNYDIIDEKFTNILSDKTPGDNDIDYSDEI